MHTFKTILGGVAVAGAMTGCVINTGGTDTNLTLNTLSDPNTSTESTDGTSTDGTSTDGTSTDGTASASETGTTAAPTTGTPTTTSDTTGGGAMCGWDPNENYYSCGFEGEDPSGVNPIGCPDGLVVGDPCGTVTPEGCCDADGNNWYCGNDGTDEVLVLESCAG